MHLKAVLQVLQIDSFMHGVLVNGNEDPLRGQLCQNEGVIDLVDELDALQFIWSQEIVLIQGK